MIDRLLKGIEEVLAEMRRHPADAGVHGDVRREWSALLAHAATAADDQGW